MLTDLSILNYFEPDNSRVLGFNRLSFVYRNHKPHFDRLVALGVLHSEMKGDEITYRLIKKINPYVKKENCMLCAFPSMVQNANREIYLQKYCFPCHWVVNVFGLGWQFRPCSKVVGFTI